MFRVLALAGLTFAVFLVAVAATPTPTPAPVVSLCDEIRQLRVDVDRQRVLLIGVPSFFESITEERLATVPDNVANVLLVTQRAWEVSGLTPLHTAEKVLVVAGYACLGAPSERG